MQLDTRDYNLPLEFESFRDDMIFHMIKDLNVDELSKLATLNKRMNKLVNTVFADIYLNIEPLKYRTSLKPLADRTVTSHISEKEKEEVEENDQGKVADSKQKVKKSDMEKVREIYESVLDYGIKTIGIVATSAILEQKEIPFAKRLHALDTTATDFKNSEILFAFLMAIIKEQINFPSREKLRRLIISQVEELDKAKTILDRIQLILIQADQAREWMREHEKEFEGIKEMRLMCHNLLALPPEIGIFRNLTTLNLLKNKLSALPPEIGKLTKLRSLNVDGNKLSDLPPEIGSLVSLERLEISSNKLMTLPPEIGRLENLIELHAEKNNLLSLPEEIGSLGSLTHLLLGHNHIKHLPLGIGTLSSLKVLFLDNNDIESLPDEIEKLTGLYNLIVSNNKLRTLPSQIGGLTSVHLIQAQGNKITKIPAEISGLTQLRELDLSSNPIENIPPEIRGMIEQGIIKLRKYSA